MKILADRYPREPRGRRRVPPGRRATRGERWWWAVLHAEVTAGLALTFFAWGLAVSLGVAFALAMLSWIVLLVRLDEGEHARSLRHAGVAIVCGFSACAAIGSLLVLRWLAVVLLVATTLMAPRLWLWLRTARARHTGRRLASSHPAQSSRNDEPLSVPRARRPVDDRTDATRAFEHVEPATLDDDQLCRAWRSSYVHLQAARSVAEYTQLAEQRREVLDELIRRHEAAVTRWLAAGARAASNPRRFLNAASEPRHHPGDAG